MSSHLHLSSRLRVWLITRLVGDRTVIMNAHVRGEVSVHDAGSGCIILNNRITGE